jgi:DNA modification methylase
VKASELRPNPRNWRRHPTEQAEALSGILTEVGFAGAVLARETSDGLEMIDGHLRAELSGDELIPVLVLDVTEKEADKLLATFDPIGAMATADAEDLATLLKSVETENDAVRTMMDDLAKQNDIELLGLGDPVEAPDAQIDRAAELQEIWKVERGQLWGIGDHRLLCGDSTSEADTATVTAGDSPGLLVTSPPYNQKIDSFKPSGMHKEGDWVAKVGRLAYADSMPEDDYQQQQRDLLSIWYGVLADGASVFYNHKNRYRNKQVVSPLQWLPGPFKLRQEIIWRRPGSVTQNARMFLPCDERIYWLYKGDDFHFDDTTEHKTWSTVWDIGIESNPDHAVGYPVELPTRCIAAGVSIGGTVLDPFLGSGTTMVAAEQLKRICYGIEISPSYCAVILQRMTDMGLKPSLIVSKS